VRLSAAIACLWLGSASSLAGQSAPSVTATLEPTEFAVGDRARLVVTVTHAQGQLVTWPRPEALGDFEVLELLEEPPVPTVEGAFQSRAVYVLTAFELGDVEVPGIEIVVSDSTGEARGFETPTLAAAVVSVGRDDSGDIRDIKGPLEISRNWLLVLPWLLVGALVSAVGYWLYRRWATRERPVTGVGPQVISSRAPHEIALEALEHLEGSGLLGRGEVKAYYIAASEILRAYLDGRFGIDAMDMTSDDVLTALVDVDMERATLGRFEGFLSESDLVKFAKLKPENSACRELVPAARWLVVRTRRRDPQSEAAEDERATVTDEAEPAALGRDRSAAATG